MSSGFVDKGRSGLPKGLGFLPTGYLCYTLLLTSLEYFALIDSYFKRI